MVLSTIERLDPELKVSRPGPVEEFPIATRLAPVLTVTPELASEEPGARMSVPALTVVGPV
jgi:hypothetical protein